MFTNAFFALTALAVSAVSALPSPVADASPALAARWFSAPQCPGNQRFCGWENSCSCETGQVWNAAAGTCTMPPLVELVCEVGEICVCAHSPSNWCPYNAQDTRCSNDGQALLICILEVVIPEVLPQKCPSPQTCSYPNQVWCPDTKSCECKKGMYWNNKNNRCEWPALPKESCEEEIFCASDPYTWCSWDENNRLCHDNGFHKTICCNKNEIAQKCQQQWAH